MCLSYQVILNNDENFMQKEYSENYKKVVDIIIQHAYNYWYKLKLIIYKSYEGDKNTYMINYREPRLLRIGIDWSI